MSFFPLDRNILSSSIWAQNPPADLKVWLYLMLTADPRTGIVPDADPAIALRCGLKLEEVAEAMERFESPDPYSRSETKDGRRIERVGGRVRLINYKKHATKDYSTPRVQRFRSKRRETQGNGETPKPLPKTTDTDTDTDTKKIHSSARTSPAPPAYWDTDRNELVLDQDWLREEIREYGQEVGAFLSEREYDRERDRLKRELLRDPRLRACLRKANGKPSAPAKFKALASYVVSRYKAALDFKSERQSRASPSASGWAHESSEVTPDAELVAKEQKRAEERKERARQDCAEKGHKPAKGGSYCERCRAVLGGKE